MKKPKKPPKKEAETVGKPESAKLKQNNRHKCYYPSGPIARLKFQIQEISDYLRSPHLSDLERKNAGRIQKPLIQRYSRLQEGLSNEQ